MKIEKVSKKSSEKVVYWDGLDDIQKTTKFYYKYEVPGWDIPVVFAKLKDYDSYVIGSGHSLNSGSVVKYDEFKKEIERHIGDLEFKINDLKNLLEK